MWSKLLLLYIPSHATKAGADSAPSQSPRIVYITFKWRTLPFCDPGSSSLLTAHAEIPKQAEKLTTQLNSKGAAAQRYSCTEAPALCLDLNRILDKLLSQKSGLFKLCEGKNWWKTGFFTSGKLWKPCEGFVCPSPVLTQDAACKSEWWVYQTPTGVQGHAAAGEQPQVRHTHCNSRNHCRLQLLVLRGLNPPRYFRVFLYVLIIYKLWKATQDVSQLHLITHSAGKTCMSAISCTLWNVGKQ